MSESKDTPDVMKRVVLPPRRRFSTPQPPKAGALATVPVDTIPPPAVASPALPQEKSVPVSPPPGIAPLSGIPQPPSSPPAQEETEIEEKIEDVAEREKGEFAVSQVLNRLTISDPDPHFEENVVPSVEGMSPILVYLSLAASLIALGMQIWMLLSAHIAG